MEHLLESEYIKMPQEFIIPAIPDSDTNIKTLIDFVYEDFSSNNESPNYFSDKSIFGAPLCGS